MADTLFLLDGMALIYRAHFAFIRSPIFTTGGVNTSAIYGFTNTLLDVLENRNPTHLAIAFDTPEPTDRHKIYPEYKAQRESMPEDIRFAIPHIKKIVEAFNIPVLEYPGYEADDVIGTIATNAAKDGTEVYMVTPDKDYAQLVQDSVYMYKPGRQGSPPEIMGVNEIKEKWAIETPTQVIDILGLMGDASDNIPGVPGVGEKTAQKLIAKFGSMEELYNNTDQLKGKQKEKVEDNRELALLSKKLVTINREVPVTETMKDFAVQAPNKKALEPIFVEFEMNALGKRVISDDFKAGRGHKSDQPEQLELLAQPDLKTSSSEKHNYELVDNAEKRKKLIQTLAKQKAFCFDTETTSLDVRTAELIAIAFSFQAQSGYLVTFPDNRRQAIAVLEEFQALFADETILKIGHNLKYDLSVLRWHAMQVAGPMFDTMIAHFLTEPEQRHTMDYMAEAYLGYSPIPITRLIGEKGKEQKSMRDVPIAELKEYAVEDADITFQLYEKMEPLLKEKGQAQVFYDVEMPLVPVLVEMEHEGIALDTNTLADFSVELEKMIEGYRHRIFELAGEEFNTNSPKQLGEILFDKMKLVEKPKKTKTGQYSTNEQVLTALAPEHEIVRLILDYRQASKLKSTYVDALPDSVFGETTRVHTTFSQTGAITGRLASNNPNLQNIPIRTDLGKEIRRAFIARGPGFTLLAADYSQIELRVMASMSGDKAMISDFEAGHDIHAATAARVYGVDLEHVESEMRRKAKMVNFGIIYGISAFGLSQRLGIPRKEAGEIIDNYFLQYPQVKAFMDQTIMDCQEKGYVETLTGRRRYLRDINSQNHTVKSAAERNAINSPIQGTAADMIKIAMSNVQKALHGYKTQMILQVHDELVFDMDNSEESEVTPIIEQCMIDALELKVPVIVDIGTGANWLDAH